MGHASLVRALESCEDTEHKVGGEGSRILALQDDQYRIVPGRFHCSVEVRSRIEGFAAGSHKATKISILIHLHLQHTAENTSTCVNITRRLVQTHCNAALLCGVTLPKFISSERPRSEDSPLVHPLFGRSIVGYTGLVIGDQAMCPICYSIATFRIPINVKYYKGIAYGTS